MRSLVILFTLSSLPAIAAEAVRVREIKNPLQKPAHCFADKSQNPCALQTDSDEKLTIHFAKGDVVLDEVTTVVRVSSSEVRLVKGTVWVQPGKNEDSPVVQTEFGYAKSTSTSDFWVSRTDERMTVSAVSSDVEMHPRGTSEVLLVAPGIQNFMGRVDEKGRATTGFPVPIAPKNYIDAWARLSTNSKKEFEAQVAEFRERWVQGLDEASNIQQTLFRRKIASIEEAKQQKAAAQAKVEAHNRELRDMFRRKFNSGE